MTLPSAFASPEAFFEECMSFLETYQWLYKFANTDVLITDTLDKINIDHLEDMDVFDKDFDLPANAGTELADFFAKLERLEGAWDEFHDIEELESRIDVPLSPKKRHEIVYLTKEIADVCEKSECTTVVDFGSGLGYLDQYIFETSKFKVLGLECNESHYVGAKKRQRKYYSSSLECVKYIKHLVSESSHGNIEDYLRDKFGDVTSFSIVGLHACADLTIDAIRLFLKMPAAKSIVVMPCCYHKMKKEEEKFKNFPLCGCLKEIFSKHQGFEFMRIPFLRLAAHPACRTEDCLQDSVFNLLARAVLQLYADKHDCKLKRNKRKAVKMKMLSNNFTSYLNDAVNGFTLLPQKVFENTGQLETFDLKELQTIWHAISQNSTFEKAAVFILLQHYLQPVIENFVLYDRLAYLKENGIVNCRFKRIFNEKTSPRCLSLIALK